MNFACSQKVKYSKSIHLHSNPYRFGKPASPCNEMDHAVLCGGLRAIDSQWNHTLSELSGKWDYLNDANFIMKLFNFISHPSHLVYVVSFRFDSFGLVLLRVMPCTLYNSVYQVLNDTKLINNLIWIDLEVAFHMRILDLNNNGYWPIVHSIHFGIEQYETFQNVHFWDAHIHLFFDRCKFLFKQIRNRFYWNIPSNPYTDRHKYTLTRWHFVMPAWFKCRKLEQ